MNNKIITIIPKSIIWLCLAIILFSPLYVNSHLFFPFITTKTFAFNIAVEVMFLAWLFLCFRDNKYQLKFNLAVILMAVYVVLTFISSLLGDYFYHSFWSNNERSEGIILLLHLFVFLLVLTNFFKKFKDWLYIFDLFFLASLLVSLYALGQYFQLSWLPVSSAGARLTGTIGNAGYMAGYLIFSIFWGSLLFFNRPNLYLRIYYLAVILLEIFIVLNTFTRGGILALVFIGLVFILYFLFYYFPARSAVSTSGMRSAFGGRILKIAGLVVIALLAISLILLFQNKNSDFVQSHELLQRMASISTKSTTAQTRLMAWGSSYQGFKERPIFGWGYENFYQPFDKYFNPKMYEDVGSVVWFDRAHNIIFDRLITGGLLGLLAYLSLLFWPLYYLWRHYLKKEGDTNNYFIPFIFTLVVLAYFIQNLFIFEALVTYVPLFLTISFISLFSPAYSFNILKNNYFKLGLLIFFLALFFPILYSVNLKPLKANRELVQALTNSSINPSGRVELFKNLLASNTYGNQEYRRQLSSFFSNLFNSRSVDQEVIIDLAQFTDSELKKQVAENPHSVTNYLIAMQFNDFLFSATNNTEFIKRNFDFFETIKKLAPNRQHTYFEIGYSYFNLANYYKNSGDQAKFQENFNLAIEQFTKAIVLNDKSPEPYKQLAIILSLVGEKSKAIEMAKKAGGLHPTYATWADGFIKDLEAKNK